MLVGIDQISQLNYQRSRAPGVIDPRRANAVVGEITDATGLKVGAKGDLNGYIIGTKGRAKVQTIGAGGYNIQCFHFRTLIHAA